MSLFNVRLSSAIEARLNSEASSRRVSKSDIVREALTRYFDHADDRSDIRYDQDDDWSDFGAAVVQGYQTVLSTLLKALPDSEWEKVVEPVYVALRNKTIEKSQSYINPSLFNKNQTAPYEPYVSATIGLAADDVHEIKVSLEQIFFEYAWHAGDEAFDEIPVIWAAAKARVDANEPEPTGDQCRAARFGSNR